MLSSNLPEKVTFSFLSQNVGRLLLAMSTGEKCTVWDRRVRKIAILTRLSNHSRVYPAVDVTVITSELKRNPVAVMDMVLAGKSVVIMNYGHPAAILTAHPEDTVSVITLVASTNEQREALNQLLRRNVHDLTAIGVEVRIQNLTSPLITPKRRRPRSSPSR